MLTGFQKALWLNRPTPFMYQDDFALSEGIGLALSYYEGD
jgi:hypothetical protein